MERRTISLRKIELGVLSLGAVVVLILLSRWATDVFVLGSESGFVLSFTWLLLEVVAIVIGVGLTVSPYVLLARLSALVPRGTGSVILEVAALAISVLTVLMAIWLYGHYGDAMRQNPTPISSLIFAVLPGYLIVVSGSIYGVLVLIGRRLKNSEKLVNREYLG